MNEALLSWVKLYDGVTAENCPDFESLRDCHVLSLVYNQIADDSHRVDPSSINPVEDKKKDWYKVLKNVKTLVSAMKAPFEKLNIPEFEETTALARSSKEEALPDLVKLIFLYSVKGPKKNETVQMIKKLDKSSQQHLMQFLKEYRGKLAASPTPKSSAETVQTTPIKQQTSTDKLNFTIEKTKLEKAIKQLESEKSQLVSENSDLKNEKSKLEATKNANRLAKSDANQSELDTLNQLTRDKEEAQRLSLQLDNEIKALEHIRDEKQRAQLELDALNAKIRDLKKKTNPSPPSIEEWRESTDPNAIKLLQEIDESEKMIRDEYYNKLNEESNKIKKAINIIASDIKEKQEFIGDANELDDDLGTRLSNEIDALNEKNNTLNEEIMALIAKAEAIDKMKTQHSFLEHLRSSSVFLQPE